MRTLKLRPGQLVNNFIPKPQANIPQNIAFAHSQMRPPYVNPEAYTQSPAQGMTPQYPGQKSGLQLNQVQAFNNIDAWKLKGYTIPVTASGDTEQTISINGTGSFMLGFSLRAIQAPDDNGAPISVTLMINNERVIDDVPFSLLDVKYMTNMYFPFERYLSGSDDIVLSIRSNGVAQNVGAAFYYQ